MVYPDNVIADAEKSLRSSYQMPDSRTAQSCEVEGTHKLLGAILRELAAIRAKL